MTHRAGRAPLSCAIMPLRWPFRRRSSDATYGGSYFGQGRNPLDRMGLSGYASYGRHSSNADVVAYVLWRHFPLHRVLDVGCALGFVVEALRETGADALGVDVSRWAIEHAAPGAIAHVRHGDVVAGLPFEDRAFDVVCALETLEHLEPDDAAGAVAELARLTSGWVVATIPSIGVNDYGPNGFPNAKVRDDRLEHYLALGETYDGPIPRQDLMRDLNGEPIEGHLTIASYRWWTQRFADAGLERCGEMERRIHPLLARFGMTEFWNLYVFRHPGTALPPPQLRDQREITELEARWNLTERRAPERALMFLREGLGDDAVIEAQRP